MEKIKLTLYITGETPRSKKAVRGFKSLCEHTFLLALEIVGKPLDKVLNQPITRLFSPKDKTKRE